MPQVDSADKPPPGRKTNRRGPPGVSVLAEPVEVAKFWKNRKGDAVIVTLKDFGGRSIVDIRTHFTTKDGKLHPSSKGIALVVLRLPDLAASVNKALAKARELGLLEDQAGAE